MQKRGAKAARTQVRDVPPASGLKRDSGKLRYSLVDDRAEREVVGCLTYGATLYGDHNWREVENPVDRYYDAARRHMVAARGARERHDRETQMHHLAGAICSLHFLLAMDLSEVDDATFEERLQEGLATARALRAEREEAARQTAPAVET